jgi:hypothetical protein
MDKFTICNFLLINTVYIMQAAKKTWRHGKWIKEPKLRDLLYYKSLMTPSWFLTKVAVDFRRSLRDDRGSPGDRLKVEFASPDGGRC